MHAIVGVLCLVVGVVLATRPFTSLGVLVALVAAAAVVTGLTRWTMARATAGRLDDLAAIGWIALGIVIAAWPDLTVGAIAILTGAGMVVGGVLDVAGGLRGSVDERLAAIIKGLASVVFGVLALAWPDVTILVIAVVFGARTVLFGFSELLAAVRPTPDPTTTPRAAEPRRPGVLRRGYHIVTAAIVLVVALVLGGVSAKLHEGAPVVTGFYSSPAHPPSRPGQLIRSEPYTNHIPATATAWRILYTTTRANGRPAVASGIVVVPKGATGSLPVIAWAHGTTGVAQKCAPSIVSSGLEAGAFYMLPQVLESGWALVATDYVGLGTAGPHPYLVGDPEARSVLDAVRAARQLRGVDLSRNTVVWGHSQGGGAALWTGKIAPTYAPDVNVLGVAALAPASDVAGLVGNLANIPGGSIFASYVVTGYSDTYPDVKFGDYVKPTARATVRALASRCLSEPAALASVLASITTGMSVFDGPLGRGALARRLAENVPTGRYTMPLLVAQGEADTLVLPSVQAKFVGELCDGGANVAYRTYPGRDHVPLVEADSPLVPDLLAWTKQRFARDPQMSGCPA